MPNKDTVTVTCDIKEQIKRICKVENRDEEEVIEDAIRLYIAEAM